MITRPAPRRPSTLPAFASALGARLEGGADPRARVADLCDDSREVRPGCLFFARRGSTADGGSFAAEAVDRGAVAVVREERGREERGPGPGGGEEGIPTLRVRDAGVALREAADLFFARPQDALDLVGITGTKGKTTTAWWTAALLRRAGIPTAVFGTVGNALVGGDLLPAKNTTPGVLEIRRLLAEARDAGARAAVMEVSSHALHQGRTDGLPFRVGVFTNLGRDHLDYHGDLERYFAAKCLLFEALGPGTTAVLNRDDPRWTALAARTRGRVLTYGTGAEADVRVHDVRLSLQETRFGLTVGGDIDLPVATPMIGRHNARNAAAAFATALALRVDPAAAAAGLAALAEVPGRLERVLPAEDLHAFVDYAHTEESLRAVLSFLREVGAGTLVCVVGCGGDRDRTKRPRMARAAVELADRTVFTSDNPRTEDPRAILSDLEAGVPPALAGRFVTLEDRREAIRRAVLEAPAGACVLVAGKGHEDYQIVGERKLPFDDVAEVRRALAERVVRIGGGEVRAPLGAGER